MKKTTLLLLGIILLTSIYAQPCGAHPEASGKMMLKKERDKEKREQMMLMKLTEKLELTAEQSDLFLPRFREHREKMKAVQKELKEVNKSIHEKIKDDEEISDGDLRNLITATEALHAQKVEEKKRFISSMDRILNNTQIAKLLLADKQKKAKRLKEHRKKLRSK